jgi:hypothetical protein
MVEHDDGDSTEQQAQQGSHVQHHEHKLPALGYIQYLLQEVQHMATGAEVFMLLASPCRMAGADLTWVW